jgi:hypothetical protein
MAAKMVITYWRDIPSMVSAQAGRTRQSGLLDERFEKDIDRAATIAGLVGSDDYLSQWRRETKPCADDLAVAAGAEVERIHAEYPRDRVNRIVLNGGFDPDAVPSDPDASDPDAVPSNPDAAASEPATPTGPSDPENRAE